MHNRPERISFIYAVSRPGLFLGFHPVHTLIYLDRFTVPTDSQSQPSAHIPIYAPGCVTSLLLYDDAIEACPDMITMIIALYCLDSERSNW